MSEGVPLTPEEVVAIREHVIPSACTGAQHHEMIRHLLALVDAQSAVVVAANVLTKTWLLRGFRILVATQETDAELALRAALAPLAGQVHDV